MLASPQAVQFYQRLRSFDPAAWQRLRQVKQAASLGHPEAALALRTLGRIHGQVRMTRHMNARWRPPNLSPVVGAARMGYWPPPNIHRAGIEIPGLGNVPTPWDPPPPPNPLQQLFPNVPAMGSFLPLTPDALLQLIAVLVRARASLPPWMMDRDSGAMPQGGGGDGGLYQARPNAAMESATPASTTATTSVPRTATFTTARGPTATVQKAFAMTAKAGPARDLF